MIRDPSDPKSSFSPAHVTAITHIINQGAISPVLTNAGLLIVNNVVAFTSAGGFESSFLTPSYNLARHLLMSSVEHKVMDPTVPMGVCVDESEPCHMKGQGFKSLPSGKAQSLAAWTDFNTRMKKRGRPDRDYSAMVELLMKHQSGGIKFSSLDEAMVVAEEAFVLLS